MDFATVSARSVTFRSTQQRSKGVTKLIQKLFFPAYAHHKLRGTRPPNIGGLKLRQARARGKLVDRQLQRCIGRMPRQPARAARETVAVLSYINLRGYFIESAQRRVGYAPWRLATSLDLVLRPCDVAVGDDHRIVVEIKRGCLYRNMSVPNQTSKGLVPNVPVSPLCMHELQAVLGMKLLEATDTTLPVDSAWLLYVHDSTVSCHESSEFTVKWTQTTADYLETTAARLANGKCKK